MNIISEHGFRIDGRRPAQIRNINTRLGLNRNAEGSCYLEHGNTKVGFFLSFEFNFKLHYSLFRFFVQFMVRMKANRQKESKINVPLFVSIVQQSFRDLKEKIVHVEIENQLKSADFLRKHSNQLF